MKRSVVRADQADQEAAVREAVVRDVAALAAGRMVVSEDPTLIVR